jgi:hypothetical protein
MIARMSDGPKAFWRAHAPALVVTAILAFTYAYFAQGEGPNQNSRFDLVRAIVDEHRFAIDSFAANTSDKSQMGGHFYCDKAPGLSFLAVPLYALYRLIVGVPEGGAASINALYWITWFTVGLASAATGGLLTILGPRLGASRGASAIAALAWGLATPAFAYATLFYAHQWAAFLVVLSFTLLTIPDTALTTPRRAQGTWALAGFAAGFAAISEFPVAVAATLLGLYTAKKHGLRAMLMFGGAGAVPVAVLAFYNARCFGSPFTLGYSTLATPAYQAMQSQGLFGLVAPRADALYGLLFSEFRGLLVLSPFLILAPVGLWLAWRSRERRVELALMATMALAFYLLVSSYGKWSGGAAMGPRHFLPALPFVTLIVAFCFDEVVKLQPPWHLLVAPSVAGMCLIALFLCTAGVAVFPEFPEYFRPVELGDQPVPRPSAPLRDFVLPWFFMGRLSAKATGTYPTGVLFGLDHYEPGHHWDAWNWGELLGLTGMSSLLPLVVFWCAGAAVLAWALRTHTAQATS